MARHPRPRRNGPEAAAGAPSPPNGDQGAPRGLMPARGAPPAPDGPPDEGMPPGMELEEPTAEEQQLYESVVANAMKAVYSGETADMIARSMEPGEGRFPVESLANIVAPMMIGIEASASAAGQPVTREMTVQAALEIVEDIGTNLLPAAGLDPLDEGEIEGAFIRAMQLIGEDSQAGAMEAMGQQGGPPAGPPSQGLMRQPPPGPGQQGAM